jgi:hypothetical protein
VVGSAGTKRIRWSRHCRGEAIVVAVYLRPSWSIRKTVSLGVEVHSEDSASNACRRGVIALVQKWGDPGKLPATEEG